MGLFAMEFSLHVCANGHIVQSMNPGLFRSGRHLLTPLMRLLHWGLQMFLYMFPQGVVARFPALRTGKFVPFLTTSSSTWALMMKFLHFLPKSSMKLSSIGLRNLGG